MRYLGVIDFDLIGRLTFADYDIIVEAIQKQAKDADKDLHYGAYLNALAGQRDGKGKPLYPKFSDFYKHKSAKEDHFEKLREHLRSKQHE